MGDNLPTAEMTSVSEKERRKRLQKSGGGGGRGGSENGEEERDVAVRETLREERGGERGRTRGKKEKKEERREERGERERGDLISAYYDVAAVRPEAVHVARLRPPPPRDRPTDPSVQRRHRR